MTNDCGHKRQALGVDTRVHVLDVGKAAGQEARAHQEHDGDGDLDGHEPVPQQRCAFARTGGMSFLSKDPRHVGASRPEGRCQTEERSRDQHDCQRVEQHAEIHGEVDLARLAHRRREGSGNQRHDSEHPPCEQNANGSTQDGQQDRLNEEEPGHS